MNALSLPFLYSIAGTLLVVGIYFAWGRKSSKQ